MHTTTMCNHAPPPHFLDAQLLDQSQHGVRCAASFESANLLVVLAFEVKVDLGVCGTGEARCGGQSSEGLAT